MTVVNALGIHARAAARFVHLATQFESRVRVAREAREMDGKSIMGILLLAAARGSTITISADGADEQQAVRELVALHAYFGELLRIDLQRQIAKLRDKAGPPKEPTGVVANG